MASEAFERSKWTRKERSKVNDYHLRAMRKLYKLFNMRTFHKFTELFFRAIKWTLSKFNVNATAAYEKLPEPKLTILQNISLAVSAVTIWLYVALDTLYCAVIETFGLTFEDSNELAEEYEDC
ncbi:MAG: hypothetical protein ACTS5F_01785 [Candidatus Hodgkinia cicadicola]